MTVPLLRRRLIFLTGKGGAGKTTVALALGLAAASDGLRTLVADLQGSGRSGSALASSHGDPHRSHQHGPASVVERRFAERLYRASIDPQSAMEEYLLVKLPGPAGQLLRQSKLFGAFAMATPGMRELLCMGKLWEFAQLERRTAGAAPYDLVIVDGPASGHGAAMLRTPRTFAELARVGPISDQAQQIAATLADPTFTAVVVVSRAEEMAVNETLMLADMLGRASDPLGPQVVILNGLHPDRFTASELELITRAADAGSALAELAAADAKLTSQERSQAQRLHDAFGARVRTTPYLFRERLELADLALLGRELARECPSREQPPAGELRPADEPSGPEPTS